MLEKQLDSGIRTSPQWGQVPEYECRETAVYVKVSWRVWLFKMTAHERAEAVAHYRMQHLLRAHIDDASEKAARRRSRRKERKGS